MNDAKFVIEFFCFLIEILAVAFIVTAVLLARSSRRKKRECSVPVVAEIVEIEKRNMDINGPRDAGEARTYSWFPKYRFYWKGEAMEIFDNTGHREGYKQVGDTVNLYVNPEKTEDFYVAGDKLNHTLSIVFLLIGIVLTVVFVVLFLTAPHA